MSGLIDDLAFKCLTGAWDYTTLPKNIRIGADCHLERKDSFKRFRIHTVR